MGTCRRNDAIITNLPSAESLNQAALRSYFRAWTELVELWTDFSRQFDGDLDAVKTVEGWSDEWKEYTEQTQSDLESIWSLLQQSMELALKARVCAVSPFLLLLDAGLKLTASTKDIDFSELRTLDAIDLPGAVNTLTEATVSDAFLGRYTKLRSIRNKIMHLGYAGVPMQPDTVLRLAVALYRDVWQGRPWLADRLGYAGQTRKAWLHDGKYTSTHMEVLQEWPLDVQLFTNSEFKSLFGQPKTKRRYLCHHCVYEGDTRYAGLEKPECGTAYLNQDGQSITCIMCNGTALVKREECEHCPSNVIGANEDDWDGYCHSCGAEQEVGDA